MNARKIAMCLANRQCRKVDSLAETAAHFGVGVNGISLNTKRFEGKLSVNKILQKQLREIDELLHENTKAKV